MSEIPHDSHEVQDVAGDASSAAAGPPPGSPMPAYGPTSTPFPGTTEHGLATTAFVLGIMSVIGMPFFGPVAWVLGRRAVRQIDASTGTTIYRNRGLGVAGTVLGIIGTVLLALIVLAVIAVVIVIVVAARQS